MKLTQGTGRGTCWWNKKYLNLFFLLYNYNFYKKVKKIFNPVIEFFNNFNFFLNFKLISLEEIIIIFLFYNFIKILIFGSVFELI